MPETVGNEANYRGDAVPTIDLGINLQPTQDTVESDSFDNTYDENADDALLFDGGTTTINQNVTVLNPDGTAVTATGDGTVVNITGGRYDGGAGGNNACVWACPGATVNISDGTFTVGADASGAGNSVIYSTGGTVNISGGFFYTDYSWNNRYYVLNLQNGSGGKILLRAEHLSIWIPLTETIVMAVPLWKTDTRWYLEPVRTVTFGIPL